MMFAIYYAQFREATQDCKLPESDDTYLLRWLVGIVNENLKRFSMQFTDTFPICPPQLVISI